MCQGESEGLHSPLRVVIMCKSCPPIGAASKEENLARPTEAMLAQALLEYMEQRETEFEQFLDERMDLGGDVAVTWSAPPGKLRVDVTKRGESAELTWASRFALRIRRED
jgi:hypothetical protein